MPQPHTIQDYELELQSLRGAVISMGRLAGQMVDDIGSSLRSRAEVDADAAIEGERELDRTELKIDEQARVILIKYQPVASDLREVTGALRISTELERVGDDARRLLCRHARLLPWISSDPNDVLGQLWKAADRVFVGAMTAFAEHDAQKANEIHDSRKKVKKLAKQALDEISSRVRANQELAKSYLEAISAVNCLERVGDAATSIAATVIFVETAEDVRHT